MNTQVRWLQWAYPLALWLAVAVFTVLACKNIFATSWHPNPRASTEQEMFAPPVDFPLDGLSVADLR